MQTERDRAASFVDSMDDSAKIQFLARLIYELTLAGRTYYAPSASGVAQPTSLRAINELQHVLSAQIISIGTNGADARSWSELAALFLEPSDRDEGLHSEVRRSFIDAISASLARRGRETEGY